jgi:hypothetical protein
MGNNTGRYLFSTVMSQLPSRVDVMMTRLPNGAVTDALVFPSFDCTVMERSSLPILVVLETEPPAAVTLVLTPPEAADPLELVELIILHPPETGSPDLALVCPSAAEDMAIAIPKASTEARICISHVGAIAYITYSQPSCRRTQHIVRGLDVGRRVGGVFGIKSYV